MATVRPQMYQQLEDPETGCVAYGSENLEQCKQTYYLKQQNQILQNQQSESANMQNENAQLKTQIKEMQSELEALKTQQTSAETNHNEQTASIGFIGDTSTIYVSILIAVIVATVFITKQFSKSK